MKEKKTSKITTSKREKTTHCDSIVTKTCFFHPYHHDYDDCKVIVI
jgi:hypothetical protein